MITWLVLSQANAQRFLALTKPGFNNRIRYYEGSRVGFKLINDKQVFKGNIMGFTNQGVLLNDSLLIPVQDVVAFYDYEHHRLPKFLSRLFISAGLVYGTVVLVNGTLANSGDLQNSNNAIVVGSLLGVGVILLPFAQRKYKLNDKRWIKIIDVTITP
ncbi:MAG: hypothetical protein JNK61_02535 [Bacteroidia bacterium]|nr:hypothetical protein [Bacteroidia bacterium]HQV00683.1 hypothetical protein [Bacteroidia bacterium]